MFSAIDPVQEVDIRGKKRHSILKVKLVNGTWEEEVLRKKYVKKETQLRKHLFLKINNEIC